MTGKRKIFTRAALAGRMAFRFVLSQICCFGTLLREAAAIAFAMRCKVIDGR
ncbi:MULTISPECIES: hypothetical protein [Rhizobium]|uniref:hypothetical protein n=1 Tax=Rhizobium TaxID=379 RepID=UPI000A8D40E3|nr:MULTISPECIES: hypothetical protein [Rhizobium]